MPTEEYPVSSICQVMSKDPYQMTRLVLLFAAIKSGPIASCEDLVDKSAISSATIHKEI